MISNYQANDFLKRLIGQAGGNEGAVVYLALSTSEPSAAGGGVAEPSAAVNYARTLVVRKAGNGGEALEIFAEPVNGSTHNVKQISFNKATGAWGTLRYAALMDAKLGGNLLWYGELIDPIAPVADEVAIIEANNLTLTIT